MKNIKKIAILLTLGVTACTTDPYTGEKQISKTALYGVIGAGTGALVGQLAGGDTKSTLIGAAAGGAIGGGYGLYRDNQEAQLRKVLQGTGVQIKRDGENTQLIMPSNVTFSSAQSEVQSSFYPVLNSVSVVLKKYNKTQIAITGHTDSVGKADYNQNLSEKRAQSVQNYLVSQGIPMSRISAYGAGAGNPIASNSSDHGREKNRRVEITLVPLSGQF